LMSVYAFMLCLCCTVCRLRPCDGLITRPRSPTVSVEKITKPNKRPGPNKELQSHWSMNKLINLKGIYVINAKTIGRNIPTDDLTKATPEWLQDKLEQGE
jgi:hypothetical protein